MNWQPIETAPRDGTRILLWYSKPIFTGIPQVIGWFDDDRYSNIPRPYWSHDLRNSRGVRDTRANQPTHWMPLPEEPKP